MAGLKFKNNSFFFINQTGCLLPLLITFNFFFGWMFFKPLTWLCVGGILILLFILNSYIFAKRIRRFSPKQDNVIDVKGEVVDGKEKSK